MKKYQRFLSENFQFSEVKFSTYLHRRVFVMTLKKDQQKTNLMFMRFFFLVCYKNICHGYLFELHRKVDAIQMGTHTVCLYKEVNKKYSGCNLKTTELLDCALIGVCAVIRSNTVYLNSTDQSIFTVFSKVPSLHPRYQGKMPQSPSRKHAYIILTTLKPHFYIVKLGLTEVYIIFLISAQNIY